MSKLNQKRTFTQRAVSTLQGVNDFTKAVESLLVDTISGFMPWLTPIVPAIMTYEGMIEYLKFPQWAAVVAAVVVETLGLAGVTTTFQFWDYNDAKGKSEQRAPVIVALSTAVFYLVVVLTVNVIMDERATTGQAVAKGMLSSLSLCGGIILALRSQHARRLQENREAKEERKLRRLTANDTAEEEPEPQANPQVVANGIDWRKLTEEERRNLIGLSPKQISLRYPNLSERATQLWAQRLRELGGNGNGHHQSS